jgi:two-component system, OmpR family, response regulator
MVNLHVLFADDDADIRNVIALSLQRDPFFVVRGCASGSEALATAMEWRPDLTLLDVMMPGMNGPTVLTRLRADRHTAAIPVVFVTAHSDRQECADLKARGAAGVIPKPFDPGELANELRRFVPVEGVLSAARQNFLLRLDADAFALSLCRAWLTDYVPTAVLTRIGEIAHALAGAAGIYGFAGIGCESAALWDATENILTGRARGADLEQALDRLLHRIRPDSPLQHALPTPLRHSAATA